MSLKAALFDNFAATSGLLSCALFIGWRRFVREDYAAAFAACYAAVSMSYMLALASLAMPEFSPWFAATNVCVSVAGLMLLVAGFRLRSKLLPFPRWICLSGAIVVAAGLGTITVADHAHLLPAILTLAGAGASLLSASAVRRGPSVGMARGGPSYWLFLVHASVLLLLVGCWLASPGMTARSRDLVAFLFYTGPSAGSTGIGLFAILLLVEDLAVRLRRLAAVDPLTGVLNRRGIEQAVEPLVAQARRNRQSIAIVAADLDRFKAINDRFGHTLGDQVLQRFATHVCRMMRDGDLVGRLGGEEFVLVLASADPAEAKVAIERLQASLAGAFVDLALPVSITASYGIAAFEAGDTLASMLTRADRALYRAKAGGRDRIAFADPRTPPSDRRFRIAWAKDDIVSYRARDNDDGADSLAS